MRRRWGLLVMIAVAQLGCGAAVRPEPPVAIDIQAPTAQREAPPPEPSQPAAEIAEPLALVPPPPALPPFGGRTGFPSQALRDGFWATTMAPMRAPDPPSPRAGSLQAVQAWAERDFSEWLTRRRTILVATERRLNEIARVGAPPHELGTAAALVAWLYDGFAHAIARVATIPEEIVADDELLPIYAGAIDDVMRPLLATAATRLEYCASALERAGEGWWTPWLAYCRARHEVVREPRPALDAATIRARLERWAPSAPADEAVSDPAALPAEAPRPRAVPRAQAELVTAFDRLVHGELLLAAGRLEDARAAWVPFVETAARLLESSEPALAEILGNVREWTDDPDLDSEAGRMELAAALRGNHQALFEHAVSLDDARARCWTLRSAALGALVLGRDAAVAERRRELSRLSRERRAFAELQARAIERARSLDGLEGDALVQQALASTAAGGLARAERDAVVAAVRAYVASVDTRGPERDALVRAGLALASASHEEHSPSDADREEHARLEARIAVAEPLLIPLAGGPGSGRAALARVLGDAASAERLLELSGVEATQWQALGECR